MVVVFVACVYKRHVTLPRVGGWAHTLLPGKVGQCKFNTLGQPYSTPLAVPLIFHGFHGTMHISSPASAQISAKPPSDVERGHSSVETHNMQELIKRIEGNHNNYDKYVHRDMQWGEEQITEGDESLQLSALLVQARKPSSSVNVGCNGLCMQSGSLVSWQPTYAAAGMHDSGSIGGSSAR